MDGKDEAFRCCLDNLRDRWMPTCKCLSEGIGRPALIPRLTWWFIVIKIIDAVDLWRRLIEEAVNISRT